MLVASGDGRATSLHAPPETRHCSWYATSGESPGFPLQLIDAGTVVAVAVPLEARRMTGALTDGPLTGGADGLGDGDGDADGSPNTAFVDELAVMVTEHVAP